MSAIYSNLSTKAFVNIYYIFVYHIGKVPDASELTIETKSDGVYVTTTIPEYTLPNDQDIENIISNHMSDINTLKFKDMLKLDYQSSSNGLRFSFFWLYRKLNPTAKYSDAFAEIQSLASDQSFINAFFS